MSSRRRLIAIFFALLLPAAGFAQGGLESWETVRARFNEVYRDAPNRRSTGFKPWQRWQWHYEQRAFPFGDISGNPRLAALAEIREHLQPAESLDEQWTFIGPSNIAGRMLAIAFEPGNPEVMYAGSASGGLWKSTDSGLNWFAIDDNLPTLAVAAVVVDPTDPGILYIGTGEGNFNGDAVWGVGVLKSVDGGVTWDTTGLNWSMTSSDAVNEMIIDPGDPDRLFAACNSGVYRSLDAGDTWERVLNGTAKHVLFKPGATDTLFAALGYPWGNGTNGVWRSPDGGESWTRRSSGFASPFDIGRVSLAACQSNPDVLVAGVAGTFSVNGAGLLGVYRSENAGDSWTVMAVNPNFYGGQGWYDNITAIKPDDDQVVYAGGVDFYRSTNAGMDWDQLSYWWYPPGDPQYTHADLHAYAWYPGDPDRLFVGSDGGIYESLDAGLTWTPRVNGLATMQFYAMGSAFLDENIAYGGTQDQGTNKFSGTDQWEFVYGGDGGECVIDYTDEDIVYAEWQFGNHVRSLDGGRHWQDIMDGIDGRGAWVAPVIMDHWNPEVLYTATTSVYKTVDRGDTWTATSDPLTTSSLVTLSQDFFDPGLLYAGVASSVWRSEDGGASWVSISSGLPGAWITEIQADPEQPDGVWAVFSGYGSRRVMHSGDRGATWADATGDLPVLPVNTVEIAPGSPRRVYVGTDLGVFVSNDDGANWLSFNDALPNVVVDDLDLHLPTMQLRAATHGRGMWQVNVAGTGIYLTSMDGGEVVGIGGTEEISWFNAGLAGTVTIELMRDWPDGAWESLSTDAPVDESFPWTVNGPPTTTARVRVLSNDNPGVGDTSRADFTITQPAIHLLQPQPGEEIGVGVPLTILWERVGVQGAVQVQLNREYPAGSWVSLLTVADPDSLEVAWLAEGDTTEHARLRVVSLELPDLFGEMDGDFSIVTPELALLSPAGGEVWEIGEDHLIEVATRGLRGSLRYFVSRGDPIHWRPISSGVPVEEPFTWTVVGPPSAAARIRVAFYQPGSLFLSDSTAATFEILDPAYVRDGGAALPKEDELTGAYPNPFNSVTEVSFGLATPGEALLRVFNIEGRLVRSLFAGRLEAGYHRVSWEAGGLASGVYFLRLDTHAVTRTRKVVLTK